MSLKSILDGFFRGLKGRLGRTPVLQSLVEAWNKRTCDKDAPYKVLAHNFHREVVFKNIPRDRMFEICRNLDDFIVQNTILMAPEDIKRFLHKFKSSLCAGDPVERETDKHLSRIVTESYFWVYCAGRGPGDPERTKDRYFDKLIEKGLESCVARREKESFNILKKEVGGRLPIIWITHTKLLDRIKSRYRTTGFMLEAVRNALGLYWVDVDDKLLEIEYPANFLQDLHTPTIFDAGLRNQYFQPQKESGGWGRTIHLKTLKKSLPECVHWIALLPRAAESYKRLGRLTNEQPDVSSLKWLRFCKDSESDLINNHC